MNALMFAPLTSVVDCVKASNSWITRATSRKSARPKSCCAEGTRTSDDGQTKPKPCKQWSSVGLRVEKQWLSCLRLPQALVLAVENAKFCFGNTKRLVHSSTFAAFSLALCAK
jgi:hypothetical protein